MGMNDPNYTDYNREERDICAHLFRLLLDDQKDWKPLRTILGNDIKIDNPRIYCEVALIRDAYFERKKDHMPFMTELVELVATQEGVKDHTPYPELDPKLRDPNSTHPKQIRFKMKETGADISASDKKVYGEVQSMFNAKPDLLICTGNDLVVYEAKYTMYFEDEQMKRTKNIADVWAALLFEDLGFSQKPNVHVQKLGLAKYEPNLSWEKIHDVAKEHWGANDFSVKVFSKVL